MLFCASLISALSAFPSRIGVDEVLEVRDVAQAGNVLVDELAIVVVDPVATRVERHHTAVAVDADEGCCSCLRWRQLLPSQLMSLGAEVVRGIGGVGRLLVVVKVVAAPPT